MRAILVRLHRYLGLSTALFLALAGLSGSLLAFQHELDAWLNPGLHRAQARGAPLTGPALIERLETLEPARQVWYMAYDGTPGESAMMALAPRPGHPEADYKVVYLDPVSAVVLGERRWGACCFQAENLVPFLLEFHHSLSLPGAWGLWLMGVVAIVWVVDSLVALALTLPRGRPFLGKWWRSWTIRTGTPFRLTFDLHRAGGLWLWLLIVPVAISSVAMNLPEQVFKPTVSLLSDAPPSVYRVRSTLPTDQLGETRMNFRDIQPLALAEAARLGLDEPVSEFYYSLEYNFFGIGFGNHDSGDSSWLFFHGTDGRLLGQEIAGRGTWGERFYRLQLPIHGGRIAGLPGRIVIAVLGLAIAGLSLTGVYIAWRKHRARRHGAERARA